MRLADLADLILERDEAFTAISTDRANTDLLWSIYYNADDRIRAALGSRPIKFHYGRRPDAYTFGCCTLVAPPFGTIEVVELHMPVTKNHHKQVTRAHAALTMLELARMLNVKKHAATYLQNGNQL